MKKCLPNYFGNHFAVEGKPKRDLIVVIGLVAARDLKQVVLDSPKGCQGNHIQY